MNHKELVQKHKEGAVKILIHRDSALHINDTGVLKGYKGVLLPIVKILALPAVFGGLISIFWIPWYLGIVIFIFGLFLSMKSQDLASNAVRRKVLAEERFYEEMLAKGVVELK